MLFWGGAGGVGGLSSILVTGTISEEGASGSSLGTLASSEGPSSGLYVNSCL